MRSELQSLKSLAGPFPAFDISGSPGEPGALFSEWLREAIAQGVKEPHAMTLSTVDENGAPDARLLILKDLDERGWHFATSTGGPKGRQLAGNPAVALTFYWPILGRQVRIRGMAQSADRTERDADFRARVEGARAMALAARQSKVLSSDEDLEEALRSQRQRIAEDPQIVAPNWGLFVVVAREVEFFQGDTERRHERLLYRREAGGWIRERLWP